MNRPSIENVNEKMAFEVENIWRRENYSLLYDPEEKVVSLYDTSRGSGNLLLMSYKEINGNLHGIYYRHGHYSDLQINPLEQKTAYGYFRKLYEKSVNEFNPTAMFIGWVHSETFEPLED
jgi:hypothetical protein